MQPDSTPRKIFTDTRSISIATPRWLGRDREFTYQRIRDQGPEIVASRLLPDGTSQEISSVLRGVMGKEYSFSREGARLAYIDGHVEERLIVIKSGPNGLSEEQFIGGTQRKHRPAVSPDGTAVAFAMGATQESTNLFVVPLAGGAPQQISKQPSAILDLAWSPDGQHIAYAVTANGVAQLFRAHRTSGFTELLPVTDMSTDNDNENVGRVLLWAPGRDIAYLCAGNRNIGLLNTESGTRRRLIGDESVGWIFPALYSPDGTGIVAVWSRRDSQIGVWNISVDGDATRMSAEWELEPIGWSADSSHLNATTSHVLNGSLAVVSLRPDGVQETLFTVPSDRHLNELTAVPGTSSFVAIDIRHRSDIWLTGSFDPESIATAAIPPSPLRTGQLPPGHPAELQAALVNGDFENGEIDRLPLGWHVWEGDQQYATASTSEKTPYQGRRCAQLDEGQREHASLVQIVDAAPYRGRRLQIRGALRVELTAFDVRGEQPGARLWSRADCINSLWSTHVRIEDAVGTAEWTLKELVIDIPKDAEFLSIGADFIGKGTAWLDAVTITEVNDAR